jgi:endoribonuclease Dicer
MVKLSDKSLADCVEALIGCYLIHFGPDGAKLFLSWLGFKISDTEKCNTTFLSTDETKNMLPDPLLAIMPDTIDMSPLVHFSKNILNYTFRNIVYLYQAFTHPSYTKNRYTASYQKLELVGDAVIDILITQYIFNDDKEYSPGNK